MGLGILVCGLNGSGKSTLGKALADALGFHFIDSEDLYFPQKNSKYPYASLRAKEEVEALLMKEIQTHENFVFATVKEDYGIKLSPFFQYAIVMEVPKEIRMQRVKNRSFQKFGDRMLPGGDLYEQEERFFEFVQNRNEDLIEEWIRSLNCTVIKVNGMNLIEENIEFIREMINK